MADRKLKAKPYVGKPGPLCGNCTHRDAPMILGGGSSGSYMLVSAAPTEGDRRAKYLLSGMTSNRLKRQLGLAGILMDDCYVATVIRCVGKPGKTSMRCCRPLLEESIRDADPQIIITLGSVPFEAFYPGCKIKEYHGAKIMGDTYTLVPMFHPNAIDETPELIRTVRLDYAGMKKRKPLVRVEGEYSIAHAIPKITVDRFGYDSETTGLSLQSELLGVSISTDGSSGVYIPAKYVPRGVKFGDTAVMHNAKYDLGIAESNDVCRVDDWNDVDDTMILAYCMNKKPLGLKALAIQELGMEMTRFKDVAVEGTLEDVDAEDVTDYAAADADVTLQLWDHLWKLASARERRLYETIEKPLPRILAKMQLAGALVDVPYFEALSADMAHRLDVMQRDIFIAYGIDAETLASPTKLAVKLTGIVGKAIKSTGHFELDDLKGDHPVIEDLLKWRPLYKLKTAFVDSILRLQTEGMVFTEFGQTDTNTGRMNARKPNLMQLPKHGDKSVRKGFVAPEGHIILSLDNSQIDLRSLAYLSQDEELLRIFRDGLDVHSETSMKIHGTIDEDMRRVAKVANFLTVFGGGDKALARKTDIPLATATAFLAEYWALHGGVEAWVSGTHKFLHANGYVETAYGRRRYIPQVHHQKYQWAAERMGQNSPVQGTSADVIKLQMAAVERVYRGMWAQVHDELIFYIPRKGAKELAMELKLAMEGIDCPFDLKVEGAMGPNLGEMTKIEW